MPSPSRNISEQDRSIKARSHELFVEPLPSATVSKPLKSFPDYVRETPAQPLSPATTAILWFLGILVAILLLAALWRMTHRPNPKTKATREPEKTAMATLKRKAIDLVGAIAPSPIRE